MSQRIAHLNSHPKTLKSTLKANSDITCKGSRHVQGLFKLTTVTVAEV